MSLTGCPQPGEIPDHATLVLSVTSSTGTHLSNVTSELVVDGTTVNTTMVGASPYTFYLQTVGRYDITITARGNDGKLYEGSLSFGIVLGETKRLSLTLEPVSGTGILTYLITNGIAGTGTDDLAPIAMVPAYYTMKGQHSEGGNFSTVEVPAPDLSQTSEILKAGSWSITISALNDDKVKIGEASTTVIVVQDSTKTCSVTVNELAGNGNLNFTATASSAIENLGVIAKIHKITNGSVAETGTEIILSQSGAVYSGTKEIANGFYQAKIYRKKGQAEVLVDTKSLRVVQNQTTEVSSTFEVDNVGTISLDLTDSIVATPMDAYEPTSMKTARYRIIYSGPDDLSFTDVLSADDDFDPRQIVPGAWKVTVIALNDEDHELGRGTATCTVTLDENFDCPVTIFENAGTGKLKLEIKTTADIADLELTAMVSDGSIPLTKSGATYATSESIPNGIYSITITDGTSTVLSFEARVAKGLQTLAAPEPYTVSNTGSAVFSITNQIAPTPSGAVSVPMETKRYSVTGTRSDGRSFTDDEVSPSFSSLNLTAGTWSFEVKALNEVPQVIGKGAIQNVIVRSGEDANTSMVIEEQDGEGTIDFEIMTSKEISDLALTAVVLSPDGTTEVKTVPLVRNSKKYTAIASGLDKGLYEVEIRTKDLKLQSTAVRVVKGLMTPLKATYTVDGLGSGVLEIENRVPGSTTLQISGVNDSYAKADTLSASATGAGTGTVLAWYLDNSDLSQDSTSISGISLSTLPVGNHSLKVIERKQGRVVDMYIANFRVME